MRNRALIVIVLIAAAVAVALWRARVAETEAHRVQRTLRAALKSRRYPSHVPAGEDSTPLLVRSFYRQRRYAPAWSDGIQPLPRARALVGVLDSAATEGLEAGDYLTPRMRELLGRLRPLPLAAGRDPRPLAELDLGLSAAFLRYASDLFDGRVDPRRLPTEWLTRPRRTSLLAQLRAAVSSDRVAETLHALAPHHPEYARLRESLARYRQIAARGGWPPVAPGPLLGRGARGPRVRSLRALLAATGDLSARGASADAFDASVEHGVRAFQSRHGLSPTGRVGADELAAMNVPVEARMQQIELNMERWRWLPDTLGRRAIVVNIPDYTLRAVEDDHPVLDMRVVVGEAVNHTPVFSDTISRIVFGPSWNIPERIVGDEMLPQAQNDPEYFARNHIRIFDGPGKAAREIDPRTRDWSAGPASVAAYSFRQDPGPDNALGHVKFMCPNQFNVYLHDTPAGHLFNLRERDFSHGCIRVEHPVELADYLLGGRGGWTRDRIVDAMHAALDSSVALPQPAPVHILYWTAWVDDRGALELRKDIYDLDAIVDHALRRHAFAVSQTAHAVTRAVSGSAPVARNDGRRPGARQPAPWRDRRSPRRPR